MSGQRLDCQRDKFDLPGDITYLNCGYQGPQLRISTEAGEKKLLQKARPWTITPDDFFVPADRLRKLFARMIGARTQDIAIVPSVSYAMSTAAANLPRNNGQHTVMLAEQFPSHVYPWTGTTDGDKDRIRTVQRPHSGDWTDDVIQSIDSACAIAALPGVHWTDGYRLRLDDISRHCADNGTALCLDLTQSLGVTPFSVSEVEADFVAASVYKWMLGPPGVCLLYVNPRHQHGKPIEPNWLSRRDSHDFAGLTDYTEEFQPGARRYDAGGRANLVNMAIAISALEQIESWGVENITDYISKLTGLANDLANDRGLSCTPKAHRSPHIAGIGLPRDRAREVTTALHEQNIYVSLRGNKLRITPHLYNTRKDIERLFEVLDV